MITKVFSVHFGNRSQLTSTAGFLGRKTVSHQLTSLRASPTRGGRAKQSRHLRQKFLNPDHDVVPRIFKTFLRAIGFLDCRVALRSFGTLRDRYCSLPIPTNRLLATTEAGAPVFIPHSLQLGGGMGLTISAKDIFSQHLS